MSESVTTSEGTSGRGLPSPREGDPPLQSSSRDSLSLEATPRAGGVPTPGSVALGASTSGGHRPVHRSLNNSARFWQRDVVTPVMDGDENDLQNAESYRQNRRPPSSIKQHRTSSPCGPSSPGSKSPQLWRGETIEETLSQNPSPMHSPQQSNVYASMNDYATIGFSNWSSRRSSAFPVFGRGSIGVASSVKGVDFMPWNPIEEHRDSSGAGTDTINNDENNNLGIQKHRGEYVFTKKHLMDRIDNMERRFQNMERAVLQALERIETHQLHLDQTLTELQEQQQRKLMYSPSVSTTRVDVSVPRDETREPSRTVDS
ncbi:uncharacterized protein TM35_000083320 [Trypanosoma theileri]|uniref:Uncharacterized protein n=1 Tax=Trypanosoma theileri TaxID=67003 RepID=A0A1X0P0R4_9TRYP|nr:uncharacterized protein TM35_000083320 [Trypanosoma theileri]ORC90534.1 hypothetical protein TM35_000083320 [Trypanosoma theileri]